MSERPSSAAGGQPPEGSSLWLRLPEWLRPRPVELPGMGRVRLIEQWDSMDDLAAHLAALRASSPAPSPVAVLSTRFEVFEATPSQFPSA